MHKVTFSGSDPQKIGRLSAQFGGKDSEMPLDNVPPLNGLMKHVQSEPIHPHGKRRSHGEQHTLMDQFQYNMQWQWMQNPSSCNDALLQFLNGSTPEAFSTLLQGQKHNSAVQALYKSTRDTVIQDHFWWLVLTTPTDNPVDWGTVDAHITDQFRTNVSTLDNAWKAWVRYHETRNRLDGVRAICELNIGQIYNPSAVEQYRAGFIKSEQALFEIVQHKIVVKGLNAGSH